LSSHANQVYVGAQVQMLRQHLHVRFDSEPRFPAEQGGVEAQRQRKEPPGGEQEPAVHQHRIDDDDENRGGQFPP